MEVLIAISGSSAHTTVYGVIDPQGEVVTVTTVLAGSYWNVNLVPVDSTAEIICNLVMTVL